MASQRPATDPVIDHWMRRDLQRLYGEVLREPIPDELLRLVDGIAVH